MAMEKTARKRKNYNRLSRKLWYELGKYPQIPFHANFRIVRNIHPLLRYLKPASNTTYKIPNRYWTPKNVSNFSGRLWTASLNP